MFGVVLLVSAACIGSAKATTTTFYVASIYDDAQEVGYGTGSDIWDNSGGFVEVDRRSSTSTRVSSGFRFSGITVPKGSTINSATFKPYMATAVNDDLYCNIYGHAVDNSEDFSSTPYISDTWYRSQTTASTSIGADAQGVGYKSYTVTSIVQELVNRSGWVSGYALSLLMIATTGSNTKNAQFYAV